MGKSGAQARPQVPPVAACLSATGGRGRWSCLTLPRAPLYVVPLLAGARPPNWAEPPPARSPGAGGLWCKSQVPTGDHLCTNPLAMYHLPAGVLPVASAWALNLPGAWLGFL